MHLSSLSRLGLTTMLTTSALALSVGNASAAGGTITSANAEFAGNNCIRVFETQDFDVMGKLTMTRNSGGGYASALYSLPINAALRAQALAGNYDKAGQLACSGFTAGFKNELTQKGLVAPSNLTANLPIKFCGLYSTLLKTYDCNLVLGAATPAAVKPPAVKPPVTPPAVVPPVVTPSVTPPVTSPVTKPDAVAWISGGLVYQIRQQKATCIPSDKSSCPLGGPTTPTQSTINTSVTYKLRSQMMILDRQTINLSAPNVVGAPYDNASAKGAAASLCMALSSDFTKKIKQVNSALTVEKGISGITIGVQGANFSGDVKCRLGLADPVQEGVIIPPTGGGTPKPPPPPPPPAPPPTPIPPPPPLNCEVSKREVIALYYSSKATHGDGLLEFPSSSVQFIIRVQAMLYHTFRENGKPCGKDTLEWSSVEMSYNRPIVMRGCAPAPTFNGFTCTTNQTLTEIVQDKEKAICESMVTRIRALAPIRRNFTFSFPIMGGHKIYNPDGQDTIPNNPGGKFKAITSECKVFGL